MHSAKNAVRFAQIALAARPSRSLPRRCLTSFSRSRAAVSLAQPACQRFASDVASTAEAAANAYRQRFEISLDGSTADVPAPWETFDQAAWPAHIDQILRTSGYPNPTPIQAQCWSVASAGQDLIAVSATGSGKTLGYVLPALKKIESEYPPVTRTSGPVALVLGPTRELAVQIQDEAAKYCMTTGTQTAVVYGGAPRPPQARALAAGPALVIATPGRLIDMLEAGYTTVQNIRYLCLDEADRMMDMGFGDQIRRILHAMPEHQTLMFSATWPRSVQSIALNYMKNHIRITVGSTEIAAKKSITQNVEFLEAEEKRKRLVELLEQLSGTQNKVLIFVTKKREADMLSEFLHADGWPVFAMHGDKSQDFRQRTLDDFRSGRQLVMIATDVAARGLDVTDITCVVNYDLPRDIDTYVHRIGRTARGSRTGIAYSFMSEADRGLAAELADIMQKAGQQVPSRLTEVAMRQRRYPMGGQRFSRSYNGRQMGGSGRIGGYRARESEVAPVFGRTSL